MAGRARRSAPRRRRPQRRQPDSAALRGIKQGVGRSVARAFGAIVPATRTRRRARRGGKRMAGYHPCFHDAFHHCHLPLPRPIGPYTVIRTTRLIKLSDPLAIFGPLYEKNSTSGYGWDNIAAVSMIDTTKTAGTTDNLNVHAFDVMTNASWNGAQIVPSAFSVQIMNPNALQTTSGIVYAGRIRTAYKLSENVTKTGDAISNEFISYNNPRLLAAAKLAFRGVQIDCVPYNMSELANFTPVYTVPSAKSTWSATSADNTGFAPIFVVNSDKIELQYLVCCEWRVRFDPSNPAQASHIQHTHASENIWMRALHAAEALGNGVVDIADRVAETGNAVFNASAATYRGARGMRALTAGVGALALGA